MTFKEWLSRWYHHRTAWRSGVGAAVKFVVELVFWFVVMAILMSVGSFIPLDAIPDYQLFSNRFSIILGSMTLLLTTSAFCIFTLPPSEIEQQSQS